MITDTEDWKQRALQAERERDRLRDFLERHPFEHSETCASLDSEQGSCDCDLESYAEGRAELLSGEDKELHKEQDSGIPDAVTGPVKTTRQMEFIASFDGLAHEVFENAKAKGWWDTERNNGEMFALMHSELSEALEAIRNASEPCPHCKTETTQCRGLDISDGYIWVCDHCQKEHVGPSPASLSAMDDKIPEFLGAEAELADVIIRIMDMAHARKWRVAEAVIAKMAMNKGRPYKHGRKAF